VKRGNAISRSDRLEIGIGQIAISLKCLQMILRRLVDLHTEVIREQYFEFLPGHQRDIVTGAKYGNG